jgi:hypothetical protein
MNRLLIGLAFVLFGAALVSPLHLHSQEKPELTKSAELWEYPGAKKHTSHAGGALYMSLSTTEHDLAKVAKHYGKKFAMEFAVKHPASGIRGGDEEATGALNDSFQQRSTDNLPRAVQMAVATQKTKEYVVTVILSQAKGEEHTHIVVSFTRK